MHEKRKENIGRPARTNKSRDLIQRSCDLINPIFVADDNLFPQKGF